MFFFLVVIKILIELRSCKFFSCAADVVVVLVLCVYTKGPCSKYSLIILYICDDDDDDGGYAMQEPKLYRFFLHSFFPLTFSIVRIGIGTPSFFCLTHTHAREHRHAQSVCLCIHTEVIFFSRKMEFSLTSRLQKIIEHYYYFSTR